MTTVTYNGKELFVGNKKVNFKLNIQEAKEANGVVLILLKVPMGKKELDNVYGVDYSGRIIWRIKEPGEDLVGKMRFPYVGISIDHKIQASVVDFYGRRFFINEKTGEIIGKDIVK